MKQRPPRQDADRGRRRLPGSVALLRWLLARAGDARIAVGAVARSLYRGVVAPMSFDAKPSGRQDARRDWLLLLDVVVAVALYIVAAVWLMDANNAAGRLHRPQMMHLVAAAGTLPVALRRRRPHVAWQIVLVAVVVTSGWVVPAMLVERFPLDVRLVEDLAPAFVAPQVIAYVLCLYAVASLSSRAVTVGAWLWSLVGLLVTGVGGMETGQQNAALWAWSVAVVSLVSMFGHNVRIGRRAQAALQLQQRRNEQEQAARATLEERSRIARELHDVVAHNMSVIAIQAEAAPLKAPDDATALAAELAAIRGTALETLSEMRRILGVLRNSEDAADTAPAPGIDQLEVLVDKVAVAGMDVRMTPTGDARPVPPGVGVSVYRIVQESLSNVLRHAPGATVTVALAYEDDPPRLRVRVENGPPPAGPVQDVHTGPRHGLVGMRERAAMLHGTLSTRPTDDGGFVVEAALPLERP